MYLGGGGGGKYLNNEIKIYPGQFPLHFKRAELRV